jgi:hypothetical protein
MLPFIISIIIFRLCCLLVTKANAMPAVVEAGLIPLIAEAISCDQDNVQSGWSACLRAIVENDSARRQLMESTFEIDPSTDQFVFDGPPVLTEQQLQRVTKKGVDASMPSLLAGHTDELMEDVRSGIERSIAQRGAPMGWIDSIWDILNTPILMNDPLVRTNMAYAIHKLCGMHVLTSPTPFFHFLMLRLFSRSFD